MEKHEIKVKVIDGEGRTLMPGLIDAHWHIMFSVVPVSTMMNADLGYLSLAAAKGSRETLLRGFTTVRDAGGNVFGVKRAIDQGFVDGPRVYPCGPYIGQTSGHGDFRGPNDVPADPGAPFNYMHRTHSFIADGVPDVLKRTREILRMGATQIKAMAGGGASSMYGPLDTTQYRTLSSSPTAECQTPPSMRTAHMGSSEFLQAAPNEKMRKEGQLPNHFSGRRALSLC